MQPNRRSNVGDPVSNAILLEGETPMGPALQMQNHSLIEPLPPLNRSRRGILSLVRTSNTPPPLYCQMRNVQMYGYGRETGTGPVLRLVWYYHISHLFDLEGIPFCFLWLLFLQLKREVTWLQQHTDQRNNQEPETKSNQRELDHQHSGRLWKNEIHP